MADEGGGTGLQDAFGDVVGSPDAVSGADPAVGAPAAAPAAAPAPPEIEMPPEWVGRGAPPRPEQVRNDIESKQRQADALRQRSQQLADQEHRLDADVNVANQLLAVREDDYRQLEGRGAALDARIAEVDKDVHRHDPDVNTAVDRVNQLKQQLGEPVPSRTDLMNPSGDDQPAPPPVPVETDPGKIAELRTQLTAAQAQLDRAVAARSGSDAELAKLKAEQAELAPQLAQAKGAFDAQKSRTDDLQTRAHALEQDGNASLDQARALEHEVQNLTVALPDYQQVWDKYAAEHPDQAKVGTAEGELHVPARETAAAYAQGRREEAGRLEQQATDADKAAADASNGANSRLELAQRNEEQAADLDHQAQAASQRAASLQSQADDGMQRAQNLADESDRLTREAADLRAAGRVEAADTMAARASAMGQQAITLQTDSSRQREQAAQALQSSQTAQERSAELTREATSLRADATTLQQTQTTLEQQSTKLRSDAESRDNIAKEVEDRLQSGEAFKYQLVDDRMGESITLDVPAGPPPYLAPDAISGAGAVAPSSDGGTTPSAPAPAADTTDDGAGGAPPVGDGVAPAGDVLLGDDGTGAATAAVPDATADTPAAPDAAADATAAAPASTDAPVGTGVAPAPAAGTPGEPDAGSGSDQATGAAVDVAGDLGGDLGGDPGAAAADLSDFAPSDAATVDPAPADDGLDS